MYQWDSFRIALYLKAIERGDYPRIFIDRMVPDLQPSMSLLDIGSGPGAFSLGLAPFVKRVYSMDKNMAVLEQLTVEASRKGFKNIRCLYGTWPLNPTPKVDVIVSAYSGPEVTASKQSLKKMAAAASNRVFLIVPSRRRRASFCSEELYFQKGIRIPEYTSTHTDTLRALEELNIRYKMENLVYDFGQPVADVEEGEEFLATQLASFSRETLRKHVRNIAVQKEDGLWLPNLRSSALISFAGHEAEPKRW